MSQKSPITQPALLRIAKSFCEHNHTYNELFGVTDGKAVGTFIELKIRAEIEASYDVLSGNAAKGLDIPSLNTDIKATSARQPQSSCPFRSARQKVYGLGYHLLLFVYEKQDAQDAQTATLVFRDCSFIDKRRTGDYQTTRGILDILHRDGNTVDGIIKII